MRQTGGGGVRGRALRLLTALTVGLAIAAGLLIPGAAASAAPAPATANADGMRDLAGCVQSARTVSALFVFDMSQSLTGSDTSGVRYDGLRAALASLATIHRADGQDVVVEAALSGFGSDYRHARDIVGWQRVNVDDAASTIDAFVDRARQGTPPIGEATDFELALNGAADDLADRAAPDTCRVLLFFTDGGWNSVDDFDTSVSRVCGPGGTMDRIRSDGIVVIGLQLWTDPGPPPDSLPAVALGQSNGFGCGTVPIPPDSASGVYLFANDPAGLKRLFGSIANIAEGCTVTGALGTVVDPGIRRVRVNILTPQLVNAVTFALPDGTTFTAGTDGASDHSGIRVNSTRDDFYVSMEVRLPPGVGVGAWTVNPSVPVAADAIEFCVFADLHLGLDAGSTDDLKAGSGHALRMLVRDADDEPADLSVFQTVTSAVALLGADGTPRTATAPAVTSGDGIDIFIQTQPDDARLELKTEVVVTTQSGLELNPIRSTDVLIPALNEYFPTITPLDELDLGEALRLDPAVGRFALAGSEKGPTQVCFDAPVQVLVPSDATDAEPVYPLGCVDLAAGATQDVAVSVATTTAVEGTGTARVPVTLHAAIDPNGVEQTAAVEIPVRWRFSNPINIGLAIGLLLAVIAASVLLPLLAVVLANWLTGKYDVTGLRVASIPFVVDEKNNLVRRAVPVSEGATELIVPADFAPVQPKGSRRSIVPGLWGRRLARRFTVRGVTFRAKTSWWNPFKPTRYWAQTADGDLLLSTFGQPGAIGGKLNTAPFAPAITTAAVWFAPRATIVKDEPTTGTIVVLTSGRRGADGVSADDIIQQARWPGVLKSHRAGRERPERPGTGSRSDGSAPPPPPPTPSRPRGGIPPVPRPPRP